MSTAITTFVHGYDPITQAGVVSQLRMRPEIRVVDAPGQAAVAVVIADQVDEPVTRRCRADPDRADDVRPGSPG